MYAIRSYYEDGKTRLVWAALIGYLVFAEFPDYWTWIGGNMIVAATSFIAP